jgi:hypothetical protein
MLAIYTDRPVGTLLSHYFGYSATFGFSDTIAAIRVHGRVAFGPVGIIIMSLHASPLVHLTSPR